MGGSGGEASGGCRTGRKATGGGGGGISGGSKLEIELTLLKLLLEFSLLFKLEFDVALLMIEFFL